jgi:hypothetical protein
MGPSPPEQALPRADLLAIASGRRLTNWGDWFAYAIAALFTGLFFWRAPDDSAAWLAAALFLVFQVSLIRVDRRIKALLQLLGIHEPNPAAGSDAAQSNSRLDTDGRLNGNRPRDGLAASPPR